MDGREEELLGLAGRNEDDKTGSQYEKLTDEILFQVENRQLPYPQQKRRHGEGLCRIGTPVQISEDIYTLSFLSQLKEKVIAMYVDVKSG